MPGIEYSYSVDALRSNLFPRTLFCRAGRNRTMPRILARPGFRIQIDRTMEIAAIASTQGVFERFLSEREPVLAAM